MDPELDDVPELSEYYTVWLTRRMWRLRCLTCAIVYNVPRGPSLRTYREALLSHALAHEAPVREEVGRA